MKFTSVPKKLVLTGLSAAMVVAFAPAVAPELAQASVKDAAGTPQQVSQADNYKAVATVSWTHKATDQKTKATTTTKESQVFSSDKSDPSKADYTDDDALQAALNFAAQKSDTEQDVTVTLSKDVVVSNVANDKASGVTETAKGLIASGKVTIDLNQHNVYNGWENKAIGFVDSPVITVQDSKYTVAQPDKTDTKTATVYATSDPQALYQALTEATANLDKATKEAEKAKDALETAQANQKDAADSLKTATDAQTEAANDLAAKQQAYNDAHNKLNEQQGSYEETQKAEEAFKKAESELTKAEKAKTDADTAVTKATTAKTGADTAMANAKTAKDAADQAVSEAGAEQASAAQAFGGVITEDGKTVQVPKDGYAITFAKADEGTRYFIDANGAVNTQGQNTDVTTQGQYTGTYYAKYTMTATKTTKQSPKTIATEGDVSIVNGNVTSNTQSDAIDVERATVTLGKGANVTTTKAEAAIYGVDEGDVILVDGATVNASVDDAADNDNDSFAGTRKDKTDVYAIDADNVTIGHEAKVDNHNYTNAQANITSTLDNGQNGRVAYGIHANNVDAYEHAVVTTKSTPKDEQHADQTDPFTGLIDDNHDADANKTSSVAVLAEDKANLHYGNYTGEFAVVSGYKVNGRGDYVVNGNAGSIAFGTYDGYVWNAANTEITGGKFKYNPTKEFTAKSGEKEFQVQNAAKLKGFYRAATNGDWTYVYRLGGTRLVATQVNGEHFSDEYMDVTVPKDAKDANGDLYEKSYNDPLSAYVQDKYLDKATQQIVFSESDLGKALNDGNSFAKTEGKAQPTYNIVFTEQYGTPTADAAKEGKYDAAYGALKAQADANTQTAQGVYVVTAQPKYGYQKAAKGEKADANGFKVVNGSNVEKNYGDALANLGDAKVAVQAYLVSTYADAQAYKLGTDAASNKKVDDFTVVPAVGTTIQGYAAINTADMGAYGITVTTTSDAVKQAEAKANAAKAAADKAAAEAQAKAEAAQKAAEDAKAQAEKDAAAAQQRADELAKQAAAAQKELANQKAVAKVKAKTVKGLKVKVGKKKATVSWKKASGYKYQVKYRQKNSSKTSDFKYAKTSKTSYVAKKLKSGKYYNFKVRVYKKVNGKTVYGKYTSIVTGKIK